MTKYNASYCALDLQIQVKYLSSSCYERVAGLLNFRDMYIFSRTINELKIKSIRLRVGMFKCHCDGCSGDEANLLIMQLRGHCITSITSIISISNAVELESSTAMKLETSCPKCFISSYECKNSRVLRRLVCVYVTVT